MPRLEDEPSELDPGDDEREGVPSRILLLAAGLVFWGDFSLITGREGDDRWEEADEDGREARGSRSTMTLDP